MDRVEVDTRDAGSLREGVQVGLSQKITGIVFWGLVLIGLVLVSESLHWVEKDLEKHNDLFARNAAAMAQTVFDPSLYPSRLQARLERVLQRSGVAGLRVEQGLLDVQAGMQDSRLVAYSFLQRTNIEDGAADLLVTVWIEPVSGLLDEQRKRLMIEMGALIFLFGMILQWILRRLLTRPIMGMVQTAQAFSRGENRRFDESGNDEFGYLARFINRSLDSLKQQQRELVDALDRARLSEQALFREKERAEVTLYSIAEGVITTDETGRIHDMNPVAEMLTGYTQSEARGECIDRVLHLKDEEKGEPRESSVLECLRENRVIRSKGGCVLAVGDGEEIPVEESAAPIQDHSGKTIGAVLVFEDVRQTRELTRKLSFQASHDALTGLYNRVEFERRLRHVMERPDAAQRNTTLCYLDLDQFKLVNDTCGHIAGDELLRQLARKLKSVLRERDTIARLGGDEFGVLLEDCSLQDAGRLASKMREVVHEHQFTWDGKTFDVGVSIGVVPVVAGTEDVAEALSAADVACYAAKERGRNRVHVYQENDNELRRRRKDMQWVSRIRQALRDGRFCLYQQPIVRIGGDATEVSHHEVLLRMIDRDDHLLQPPRFMGAAEKYGLMPDLDRWVIEHTLAWMATREMAGRDSIAINLSGQSLSSRSFVETVIGLIDRSGVSPDRICFEITETSVIANLDDASRFIRILKGMGCRFSLDDFGSGMSSFAYLKNLPVDYLKIDGSYVRDLITDPVDRSMVVAVNQIGHALGVETIAEYVENQGILDELEDIGVDFAQGYGIARPASLDELQVKYVN